MKVCVVKNPIAYNVWLHICQQLRRKERVVDLGACLADDVVTRGLDVTGRSDEDNRMTDRNCATIWLWSICTKGSGYCQKDWVVFSVNKFI